MTYKLVAEGQVPSDNLELYVPGLMSSISLTQQCWHFDSDDGSDCHRCKGSKIRLTDEGEAIRDLMRFADWLDAH